MNVDINKTYRTECGCPVLIYAIHEGQRFAVHGAYQEREGEWVCANWKMDGHIFSSGDPSRLDLVEVRPERVVWINEYPSGSHSATYRTKDHADKCATSDRIALHRVVLNEDTVWEEGDDA